MGAAEDYFLNSKNTRSGSAACFTASRAISILDSIGKQAANVAGLVFSVNAHVLDEDELAGALLQHLDARKEPSVRQAARLRGAARSALPST